MQSFLSLFVLIAFAHTLPTTTFKNFIPPFLGAKAPAFLGPPFDCRFLLESAHPPRTSFTMAYGGDPLLGRLRRLQVTCHWGFSVLSDSWLSSFLCYLSPPDCLSRSATGSGSHLDSQVLKPTTTSLPHLGLPSLSTRTAFSPCHSLSYPLHSPLGLHMQAPGSSLPTASPVSHIRPPSRRSRWIKGVVEGGGIVTPYTTGLL